MAKSFLKAKFVKKGGVIQPVILAQNEPSLVWSSEKAIRIPKIQDYFRCFTTKKSIAEGVKINNHYVSCKDGDFVIKKDNKKYYPTTTCIPLSEYKVSACAVLWNTTCCSVRETYRSYEPVYEWVRYYDCNEGYVKYKRHVYTDCYENEYVYEWVTTTRLHGYRFVPELSKTRVSFSASWNCNSSYFGQGKSGKDTKVNFELEDLYFLYRDSSFYFDSVPKKSYDMSTMNYGVSVHSSSADVNGMFALYNFIPTKTQSNYISSIKSKYGEYYTDSCADSNGSSRTDRSMRMTEENGGYFLLTFKLGGNKKQLKIPYYIYSGSKISGTCDYTVKSSTYRL